MAEAIRRPDDHDLNGSLNKAGNTGIIWKRTSQRWLKSSGLTTL
jgi:hypothetical protein